MKKIVRIKIFLTILILFNIILWQNILTKQKNNQIIFFDVGQGDSSLIQTTSSQQILIDGGPDDTITTKLSEKMPTLDKKIELMILTHPHDDHFDGLIDVINNYQVESLIMPATDIHNQKYDYFLQLIKEKNIKIIYPNNQLSIKVDNITLIIYYPITHQVIHQENENDYSIVIKIISPKNTILTSGDLSEKKEKEIVKKYGQSLQANILKINHHGSKTSSSPEFLQTVQPKTAIISVGKNKFGHPDQNIIKKINNLNIQILRTDLDHDISFDL